MSKLKFSLIASLVMALALNGTAASLVKKKVTKTTPKTTTTAVKKAIVDVPIPFESVEKKPTFVGGDSALNVFIGKNYQYPAEAKKNKEQGEVLVKFLIDENGNIQKSEVLTSVSPSLDAEALRLIKMMPAWNPGMQKAKKVQVIHTLPINFIAPTSKIEQALANPVVKSLVDSGSKVLGKEIESKVTKYGGSTVKNILNTVKKK